MGSFVIPAAVLILAGAAAGFVFHLHRVGRKRSPEVAVSVFSAILAAGVWFATIVDAERAQSREEAQKAEGRQQAAAALTQADTMAAARDERLALSIEEGFRRAGLEAPANVLRDLRKDRPARVPPTDVQAARRIAELETEQRMRKEQIAAVAAQTEAEHQAAIRRLCRYESYKNDPACTAYRNPAPADNARGNQLD